MNFGNWSIDLELFIWIKENVSENSTILEFGSGNSTCELIKYWNVISVEEDINWVNKYHKKYIYAPLVDEWYNLDEIKKSLNEDVDAILVDGPAYGDRGVFLNHLDYFLTKNPKIIIFDDTERPKDFDLFNKTVDFLNSGYEIEYDSVKNAKMFSYIKILRNKNQK